MLKELVAKLNRSAIAKKAKNLQIRGKNLKNGGFMGEKIKVLHIVGPAIKGGVESVVFTYSKALKDEVEPTFVFTENSTHIPEEFIKEIGGHYFVIPYVKHLSGFKKGLKKILTENKFDIVHSHMNTLSVFALKVAKQCGYPIRIAHSHSQSNKKEFVRNMIKNFLKKFSKKYATTYLACGENAGRYQFGDKTFDEGKVFVLKNAIDVDRFIFNKTDRQTIREELGVKDDEVLVGTIGRLCQQKNHQYILKIARLMPDVKFVIVGAGPLEDEDKQFIKDNNLSNVTLYGVSNKAYRFYSAFDTFILPSLYEGLPVTGVEAQVNGVYTLFSDQVSKEAQASSYLKFLPIDDKDLSLWVEELKNKHPHENHLEEVIKSGFSIKESSVDLLNLYKSLLVK